MFADCAVAILLRVSSGCFLETERFAMLFCSTCCNQMCPNTCVLQWGVNPLRPCWWYRALECLGIRMLITFI